MKLKKRLIVVFFMVHSFKLNGMFVDPYAPMNNQKWEQSKGDRLALYSIFNNPDSSDETKQTCIQGLLQKLFAADPFCLKENIEELLRNNFPQEELLKATIFATNVIDRDQIEKVHPLERWTLMHYVAYAFAQRYQLDKDLRKDGPLPVGYYVPDDCSNTIKFLTELGIAVTVETDYKNWQPHNYKASSVSRIVVTPQDVVKRFSQEDDLITKIFDPNII